MACEGSFKFAPGIGVGFFCRCLEVYARLNFANSREKIGLDQDKIPFWEAKTLEEMSRDEWESLCDSCGRCCLLKIEDWDTSEIYLTRLSCRMLDRESCRCRDYENRHDVVDDCVTIDADKARSLSWLPNSCAYRRVADGHGLAWWHPLVSGSADTVHQAGISVRQLALCETKATADDFHQYIMDDFGAE